MDRLAAIHGVYDEWGRGNYHAGFELYDPGMTLEIISPIPEAGVYEGIAGLQRYMRGFLETWDEYKIHALAVEEEADSVVVHVHHGGRASGAWVETAFFAAWTFRGDSVVRVDIAADREAAVASAAKTP